MGKVLELLASCYESNDFQKLRKILAVNCEYISEYAGIHIKGGQETYSFLTKISTNITKRARYYATVTEIAGVSERHDEARYSVGMPCIALAQYDLHQYVALVFVETDEEGKIVHINVSRDHRYQTTIRKKGGRYSAIVGVTPQKAQPTTITLGQLLTLVSGEEAIAENFDSRKSRQGMHLNIWQAADYFLLQYLQGQGFVFEQSEIEEDCIAYNISYKGKNAPYPV